MNEPTDIHDDLVDDLDALDTLDWSDEELAFQNPDIEIDGFTSEIAAPAARIETALHPIPRYPAPRPATIKYDRAVDLAREADAYFRADQSDGRRMFCLVSGNFIFGDLLEAYLCECGHIADELIIATLSLNQNNVDSLRNIIDDGRVQRLGLVVSAYWYAHHRRDVAGYMARTLAPAPRYDFAAAGLHTKITLMRCGAHHFVMHGSANMCSSGNIEQFTWERDRALYDFNRDWLERIFSRFSFAQKPMRRDRLWQLAATEAEKRPE